MPVARDHPRTDCSCVSSPKVDVGAVPGHEGHVVAEWPEPPGDGADQRIVVAAGEVRAADRAGEKHVADECDRSRAVEEHDVTGRVARAVQYLQRPSPTVTVSPWSSQRVGVNELPRRESRTCGSGRRSLSIQYWSAGCGPSMATPSSAASSAVPPAWSICVCVSRIRVECQPHCRESARGSGRDRRPGRSPARFACLLVPDHRAVLLEGGDGMTTTCIGPFAANR